MFPARFLSPSPMADIPNRNRAIPPKRDITCMRSILYAGTRHSFYIVWITETACRARGDTIAGRILVHLRQGAKPCRRHHDSGSRARARKTLKSVIIYYITFPPSLQILFPSVRCLTVPLSPHKKNPHTEVGMGIYLFFSLYNNRVDTYNIFIVDYTQIDSLVYTNVRDRVSDSNAYLKDPIHVFSVQCLRILKVLNRL